MHVYLRDGSLLRAKKKADGQTVLMKTFCNMEHFYAESKALEVLERQHIICPDDSFEHDGIGYLVLPFFKRGDLYDNVGRRFRSRLPEKEAVELMHQLLGAVKLLHEMQIGHRDIKLENVLVRDVGTIILANLGYASLQTSVVTDFHPGTLRSFFRALPIARIR